MVKLSNTPGAIDYKRQAKLYANCVFDLMFWTKYSQVSMLDRNLLHASDGHFYLYGNRYRCLSNKLACLDKVFGTSFAVYFVFARLAPLIV